MRSLWKDMFAPFWMLLAIALHTRNSRWQHFLRFPTRSLTKTNVFESFQGKCQASVFNKLISYLFLIIWVICFMKHKQTALFCLSEKKKNLSLINSRIKQCSLTNDLSLIVSFVWKYNVFTGEFFRPILKFNKMFNVSHVMYKVSSI